MVIFESKASKVKALKVQLRRLEKKALGQKHSDWFVFFLSKR